MTEVSRAGIEPRDERERLARLYDRQHERIYRLARRLSRDPEEARDLLQETFLRAARNLRSLPQSEPAAEAWLVRTVVNLCRDLDRRRFVRRRDRYKLESPPTCGVNPERAAVARASIEAALASLPARRRAVVVLAELEDLPTHRIARLLRMAEGTVRWHLSRARKQLAAALA